MHTRKDKGLKLVYMTQYTTLSCCSELGVSLCGNIPHSFSLFPPLYQESGCK